MRADEALMIELGMRTYAYLVVETLTWPMPFWWLDNESARRALREAR